MDGLPTDIRIGTRGSELAIAQTRLVAGLIADRHPRLTVRLREITTEGDRDKTSPLSVIGGRGVFTSALQTALLDGSVDAAVHSAKDLPTARPDGLRLVAFLARDDPRDVLVSRHGVALAELPARPLIGTSSRRRALQVLRVRPDAQVVDLRGNVDSRLRKAFAGELDGIVVAAAGLERLGWLDRVTEFLPIDLFVPSPGQGALAVEIRAEERGPAALLAELDELAVSRAVGVERAFLAAVDGGCASPVGALARIASDEIEFVAMLGSEEGTGAEWASERLPLAGGERAAAELAGRMQRTLRRSVHAAGNGAWPLSGRTVLLTRSAEEGDPLADRLLALGAEVVVAPTIAIKPVLETAAIERAARAVAAGGYDWIVFSSGNAVAPVLAAWRGVAPDVRLNDVVRVAAVGAGTSQRLAEEGVHVDFQPDRFTAADLVDGLVAQGMGGLRVLFPKGSIAREVIPRGLGAAGARVDTVDVYLTEAVDRLDEAVLRQIGRAEIDIVTLMSPSSAQNLARLLGSDVGDLSGSIVACIGPETAAAARAVGFVVGVVPEVQTLDGLVAAIVEAVGRVGEHDSVHRPLAHSVVLADDERQRG